MPNPEHKLANGTLITTDRGIVARCTCGWMSTPHFSSLSASAEFRDHQDRYEEKKDA